MDLDLSIELIIGLWGAVIATALAVLEIAKSLRDKPRVVPRFQLLMIPSREDAQTHGLVVRTQRSHDILWEEADVEVSVANEGRVPIQIASVNVETERSIHQIVPDGLPVILEPNTAQSVLVQPELLAPLTVSQGEQEAKNMIPIEVIEIGVMDALGKKHSISKADRNKIVGHCRALPLRTAVYRHKDTGNLVTAFQSADTARLVSKIGAPKPNNPQLQAIKGHERAVLVSKLPPS